MAKLSYTRTEGADPAVFERGVWPRFYMDTVPDEIESRRQGRRCFKQEERVEIYMAGNNLHIPVFRVSDEHRERWPKQYEAFKSGQEQPIDGTPLSEWPALNRAQILELQYLNFRTIEDIAVANDQSIQKMGMGGRILVARAKAFLDDAERVKVVEQQSAELAASAARVSELENMVKNQADQMQNLQTQFSRLADMKSPMETHIPGQHDPAELAKIGAAPSGVGSSLDTLQPSRRAMLSAKKAS